MNKATLIETLRKETNLSKSKSEQVVELFFDEMSNALTKGDRVEIRIRDNGTGIPPEIMNKIFNPFFTTKPPGVNTGLGLSISYEIVVQEHRGELKVETEEGKFTEFIIIIPGNEAV